MVSRDIEVRLTPRIIVLIYLLVGTIWAMFSDWVPSVMFKDPALIAMLAIINHWGFIAATSVLLYFGSPRIASFTMYGTPSVIHFGAAAPLR